MIYFIAYLLQGEPKAFHEKLVKDIAEKFDVHYRDQKKIPSHITLKEPFKTNRIEEVEKLLELFAKKHHSSALKIEGFSHFDDNVIFQNIHPSQQATKLINALLKELKKLPWMQWQRQKSKELTLHATLAYRDIKPKFNDIWNYVNKIDYNETISLDKITILKHENNAWHIHKEYLLL
ncbi:2'-5' RNA ligase family protein [Candidatus Woesearchaeota archaeon]|nr:2'-5' RNA ligase family protein [Candidatus Woesearchaeota archaeon]